MWNSETGLAALLLLFTLSVDVVAQETDSSRFESFPVSGHVLDSATGAPIDQASVTLTTMDYEPNEAFKTQSAPDGRFRFDHVPRGRYRLSASCRRYLTASYREHEELFSQVVVGLGLETEELKLDLPPEGVLSGEIRDDAGDPTPDVSVILYRKWKAEGLDRVTKIGTVVTDDAGAYEFAHLGPGTFCIAAFGRPWYYFRRAVKIYAKDGPVSDDEKSRSPLDVTFPLTFYPNANEADSAAPVSVGAGDHERADFTLQVVPSYSVRIPIAVSEYSHSFWNGRALRSALQVAQDVYGTAQLVNPSAIGIEQREDHAYLRIDGLPPGQYDVRASERLGTLLGPVANLDLSLDQAKTELTGSGVSVSGKLRMTQGALPTNTEIALCQALECPDWWHSSLVSSDGSFRFRNIRPGTYRVTVHSPGHTLIAAEMDASGAEPFGNLLSIDTRPVRLKARISEGLAAIKGFVAAEDGRAVAGVMVVLCPQNPNANTDLLRRAETASDGSFDFNQILPGDYFLAAIDDAWTLEWKRSAVAPYLRQGIKISIPEAKDTLKLRRPVLVQRSE